MTGRAPTYDEVLAAARRAAEHIDREWPAWKRALSEPERSRSRSRDTSDERREDPKPR